MRCSSSLPSTLFLPAGAQFRKELTFCRAQDVYQTSLLIGPVSRGRGTGGREQRLPRLSWAKFMDAVATETGLDRVPRSVTLLQRFVV
jgi:hypothetical protein